MRHREQLVAVDVLCAPTRDAREIGDRHRDVLARCRRQPDVEPDADHGRRRPQRVAVHLDQDAADLEMAVDDVVRPLERDAAEAFRLERARDRDADGEREPGQEPRALLETPAERERQAAAGDGGPGAAAAAASGGLPFGGEHDAVDVALLRAAQELRRRRVDLVDHFDGEHAGHRAQDRSLGAAFRTALASRKSGVSSSR